AVGLSPPESVQKLQAALHDKTKEAPNFRFYALYDKVYRKDVLAFAYECCKANGGAAGVDGQTFEDIEAYGKERWLDELAQELKKRTYQPLPVRRVYIPKPDGKQRPLGVPAIRDRVAQTAAVLVLEPIFESDLSFDQEIPHHSTFSKNRHGRFQQSKLFEQLFEQIVRQCVEVGLVQGKDLSVDGSFVEANAAKESRIPREQLVEAAQVNHTLRQYLKELEEQNPVEEPVHRQDQVSTTDPDSTYATKGGTPARLGYYDN